MINMNSYSLASCKKIHWESLYILNTLVYDQRPQRDTSEIIHSLGIGFSAMLSIQNATDI